MLSAAPQALSTVEPSSSRHRSRPPPPNVHCLGVPSTGRVEQAAAAPCTRRVSNKIDRQRGRCPRCYNAVHPAKATMQPLLQLVDDTRSPLERAGIASAYGYQLWRSAEDSRHCADLLVRFVHQLQRLLAMPEHAAYKEAVQGVLHNGVQQYSFDRIATCELSPPDVLQALSQLRVVWEKLACARIVAAGLSLKKHMVDGKIMVCVGGQAVPEQQVHWDGPRGAAGRNKYACVLYCTPGRSTYMPLFKQTDDSLSSAQPQSRKRMRELLPLLGKTIACADGEPGRAKPLYHSVPVAAGDMLVFGHNVPHYGPGSYTRRTQRQERIALYDMNSNSSELDQDDFPTYAKQFTQEAVHGDKTRADKPRNKRSRRN